MIVISKDSIGDLFDTYSDMVYRISLNIVRNCEEAQDVVMDTFVALMKQSGFNDEGHIKAWLIRTAENKSINVLRSARVRRTQPLDELLSNTIASPVNSVEYELLDSDEKYAQVLIWTLAQTKVSANALYDALGKKFRLGAKKFDPYLDRMCEAGFISEYNNKQPRKVLINLIEDLTEEQMEFLTKCGYTEEQLTKLFENKNKNNA